MRESNSYFDKIDGIKPHIPFVPLVRSSSFLKAWLYRKTKIIHLYPHIAQFSSHNDIYHDLFGRFRLLCFELSKELSKEVNIGDLKGDGLSYVILCMSCVGRSFFSIFLK